MIEMKELVRYYFVYSSCCDLFKMLVVSTHFLKFKFYHKNRLIRVKAMS